jgi:hypothetical protein
VNVVCVPLKAPPVTNLFLPPRSEEDGPNHLLPGRMFTIDPCKPFRTPDPVGEETPEKPELRRIGLAIFGTYQPQEQRLGLPRWTINGVQNGLDDRAARSRRGSE